MVAAALLGSSFVLQQGAAQDVPASDFLQLRLVAELPLLAINLLIALSLAWPLSRQPLKVSEILGAVILLAGSVHWRRRSPYPPPTTP